MNTTVKTRSITRMLGFAAVGVAVLALSLHAAAQPGDGQRQGQRQGQGQVPGMGGGQGMGAFGAGTRGGVSFGAVLRNPEVARMLELTPEQTESLTAAIRETMQGFQPASGGGAPPRPEEMLQRVEQMMDALQTRIDQVLTPEQQVRVRETMFQLDGGLGSQRLNARYLEALGITDAQKEDVKKLVAQRAADEQTVRASVMSGGDVRRMSQEDRERLRSETEALNRKFAEQVTALLTPEQKEKAERLTAEAPALRERLGMGTERGGVQRERGQQREGGRGAGGRGEGGPDAGSWRPGQEVPDAQTRPGGGRGGFPRPTN